MLIPMQLLGLEEAAEKLQRLVQPNTPPTKPIKRPSRRPREPEQPARRSARTTARPNYCENPTLVQEAVARRKCARADVDVRLREAQVTGQKWLLYQSDTH